MKFQEVLYSRYNTFIKAFCFNYFDRQIDVYITRQEYFKPWNRCMLCTLHPGKFCRYKKTERAIERFNEKMLFWGRVVVEYGRLTSVWSKGKKGGRKIFTRTPEFKD